MASPSRSLLRAVVEPTSAARRAPEAQAWPRDLEVSTTGVLTAPTLQRALLTLTWGSGHVAGDESVARSAAWVERLRTRRDGYLLVLLAPRDQGGLGLSRRGAGQLTPLDLSELRCQIGTNEDPATCPACAVSRWLHVAGLYSGWSLASVRSLMNTTPDLARHACPPLGGAPDPEPEWITCSTLLPAIDRYGAFDLWKPVSLRTVSSVLALRTAEAALFTPPVDAGVPDVPRAQDRIPAREFTPAEVQEVFDEADELNRRLKALLDDADNLLSSLLGHHTGPV